VNIGMEENPKFANIGDYWNDETMEKIADLLRISRYFSNLFFRDEGNSWRIRRDEYSLKLDAKPVRQRPYRLNPKYKEKVKVELERMIEAGIIEPIAEYEWISLMVLQDKKEGGIIICET
jgi:hypothetical protein